MTRCVALAGLAALSAVAACRAAAPPARDARCGTAQPLPLCTPQQAQGALTLEEFFQVAPRDRTQVRGRLVFGGLTLEDGCTSAELRLALGSAGGGAVVSTDGPLILLTEASPWRAPQVRAFEESASAFRCHAREKGFCCAHNVVGQEVVATGFVVHAPPMNATRGATDYDTWWRMHQTASIKKDSCSHTPPRNPYALPWRGRLDAVAGLAVTDLCELPK